jgi:hypothetical protein
MSGALSHFVNGRPVQVLFPAGMERALFGTGCFWGAERRFWQLPGIYVTAVGYAGGKSQNPNYKRCAAEPAAIPRWFWSSTPRQCCPITRC